MTMGRIIVVEVFLFSSEPDQNRRGVNGDAHPGTSLDFFAWVFPILVGGALTHPMDSSPVKLSKKTGPKPLRPGLAGRLPVRMLGARMIENANPLLGLNLAENPSPPRHLHLSCSRVWFKVFGLSLGEETQACKLKKELAPLSGVRSGDMISLTRLEHRILQMHNSHCEGSQALYGYCSHKL